MKVNPCENKKTLLNYKVTDMRTDSNNFIGSGEKKSPLVVMSAITGKPTKDKIWKYLKGLSDNGIQQILLYPRSGCELEYLSEKWFSAIGDFIKTAEQLEMNIWLYDDFNWPSGDACGRVTAIEEYRLMSIETKGENIGRICRKSRHNSGLFGEKFFPNLLSHGAVDYFIKCTHEEYYNRFGEYFGTVIKGIFTDEASVGYCAEESSIPYYYGIERDYYTRYHRDFHKDMEDGYGDFYLSAMELVSSRFYDCYISKIADWCKTHGIEMTGHFMSDAGPFWSVKHNGRFLENLSGFSLPGIDEIETDFTKDSEMSLFGVAEYVGRERGAMAELFALGPCDMSYAKRRCMIYLSACHKIDKYFLAISHLDMRGNMLVTDFFNNFSTDQPDFLAMRLLSEEAKTAMEYARKDYTPDLYIRYPTVLSMKHMVEEPDLSCLLNLVNELTYNQIQWKYADTDDNTGNIPVAELNDSLEFTVNGQSVSIEEICRACGGKAVLKNGNGDTPKGVFVRKFNDGSILALNLFAPSGEYFIDGKRVFMYKYDVLFSAIQPQYKEKELSDSFGVRYCYDNMIRTMYVNQHTIANIRCEGDFSVRFAVRKGTDACINGTPISATENADILSDGIRELYCMSDKIMLPIGESQLISCNDFKYMPSVFIIGDFSCEIHNSDRCDITLTHREKSYTAGKKIYDYGKIEFVSSVTVPDGVKGIEIVGIELYTCIYADEVSIGEKAFSPYIYEINSELWNKEVEIRVVQYSSIGPIFGDVDYWDKCSKHSQWRGTPSTQKTYFGFDKINWIY
ncbi:MAG: hypothetical protein IJX51_02045 [Clostridia bacterium]|nr:hypothetical protein [Clostridia bacterium]